MPPTLLDRIGENGTDKLRTAIEWVVPTDSSPGGSMSRLVELVDSLGPEFQGEYLTGLGPLTLADLSNPSHSFAAMFVEHVRDSYYANPDTGAWQDIGFRVSG